MTANLARPALEEISALHAEFMRSASRALEAAIRIGELLTAEKQRLPHGAWLPWVEEHLPFSPRTASVTLPPPSVYLSALLRRLVKMYGARPSSSRARGAASSMSSVTATPRRSASDFAARTYAEEASTSVACFAPEARSS